MLSTAPPADATFVARSPTVLKKILNEKICVNHAQKHQLTTPPTDSKQSTDFSTMAPYKSVKYRSWYSEMHKSEYVNTELDMADAVINTDKLNTIVLDWVVQVEDDGQFDLFILLEFQ